MITLVVRYSDEVLSGTARGKGRINLILHEDHDLSRVLFSI